VNCPLGSDASRCIEGQHRCPREACLCDPPAQRGPPFQPLPERCAARKYDLALTSGFVCGFVYWLACLVLIGMAYRLGRRMLGVLGAASRSDGALVAEALALRHENAVLRRRVVRVRFEPVDRAWFAALSALIPRAWWAEVFPVTPTTLVSWHRRLVAGKYTTTTARRRLGRPPTKGSAKALILRMAQDNPQ
jgi:hypothetical protein